MPVVVPAETIRLHHLILSDGHVHNAAGIDPVDTFGPIRTFHPRRRRMGMTAADAMSRHWPRWGVDITEQPLDLAAAFGANLPVVLELGSGMGEATADLAAAFPNVGILAVDVHTPGIASLMRSCETRNLDNVRVAIGDGTIVLRTMIESESLLGIRAFFPDPWPKARHHKRRLIQPSLVALAASRLQHGGWFHTVTDWANYADQMLTVLSAEPLLQNQYCGFAPRPSWRPESRYERIGLAKGHDVRDLMFVRS